MSPIWKHFLSNIVLHKVDIAPVLQTVTGWGAAADVSKRARRGQKQVVMLTIDQVRCPIDIDVLI